MVERSIDGAALAATVLPLPSGVLADPGEEVYAACSFCAAAKAGATSAMKRAISSLT
jgi:hypothetical protein